jgi:hypothetical protein
VQKVTHIKKHKIESENKGGRKERKWKHRVVEERKKIQRNEEGEYERERVPFTPYVKTK